MSLAEAAFVKNPFATPAPPSVPRTIYHTDITTRMRAPPLDPNKFHVRFGDRSDDNVHDDDFIGHEPGWVAVTPPNFHYFGSREQRQRPSESKQVLFRKVCFFPH